MKAQQFLPRLLIGAGIVLFVLLSQVGFAEAKVTSFIGEEKGELYEYEYSDLVESYAHHLMGSSAPLFNHYYKKNVLYLLDDKNGYVDYMNVLEAYASSLLSGKPFDLDAYTSGSKAKKVEIDKLMMVSVKDGKIVLTEKIIIDTAGLALREVNATVDPSGLRIALESLAKDLSLNLTEYNQLTNYGKNLATAEIFEKKEQGFSDVKALQTAFTAVVNSLFTNPLGVILHEVNSVNEAGALHRLLETYINQLELNSGSYNQLQVGRRTVAENTLHRRPPEGFADAATLRQIVQDEAEKALVQVAQALTAINDSESLDDLIGFLLANGKLFELEVQAYNLIISSRVDSTLNKVAEARPYQGASEVKQTFNSAVATTLRSYVVINFTDYNRTLSQVLDIQMSLKAKPQWWVTGQGWRDAPREEVEKFVDPRKFIPENIISGVTEAIVAVNTLILRDQPTTEGEQLAQLQKGRLLIVEDIQQALEGTQAGTQGWWFQVTVDDVTGWIFSLHTHWVVLAEHYSPAMFQFLNLSGPSGASESDLAVILAGKGILSGTERAFYRASQENNINEVFLTSLALHESGNGKSILANGQLFEGKIVYNMFGIGAYDSNPNYFGAKYAYEQGWFTPELAIIGGARFASRNYVNHPTYLQDTLYKMRWNPATPGAHQYATDIAWASKQTSFIRQLYNQITLFNLRFDIPRYKEETPE